MCCLYASGLFLGLRLQVPLASIGDVGSYLRGGGRDGMERWRTVYPT